MRLKLCVICLYVRIKLIDKYFGIFLVKDMQPPSPLEGILFRPFFQLLAKKTSVNI